ncbi:MAG: NHLP leader peptide family RiPP precursor [Bacteroidota bacterium]
MDFNFLSSHYVGADNDAARELREKLAPIVERTYEDPEFKAEFIANPAEVISRETGASIDDLPDQVKFVVVDKSDPFALYITLPVREDMLELTDEELELVAGGIEGNGFLCIKNFFCGKKKKLEAEGE